MWPSEAKRFFSTINHNMTCVTANKVKKKHTNAQKWFLSSNVLMCFIKRHSFWDLAKHRHGNRSPWVSDATASFNEQSNYCINNKTVLRERKPPPEVIQDSNVDCRINPDLSQNVVDSLPCQHQSFPEFRKNQAWAVWEMPIILLKPPIPQ